MSSGERGDFDEDDSRGGQAVDNFEGVGDAIAAEDVDHEIFVRTDGFAASLQCVLENNFKLSVPVPTTKNQGTALEDRTFALGKGARDLFQLKEFLVNFPSKLSLLAFASSNLIFGSLVPIGLVPTSGAGLGNMQTALVFSSRANSTTETGCVGSGVGGATVTGSAACPTGFVGGNEQTGQNQTYSAAELGLVTFSNLQLIFNAIEPGNAANRGITIDLLAITLWNPANGSLLGTYSTVAPYIIADALPGFGNAGYGFALDLAQATAANARLAELPNLRIGVAANASNATGGPETVFLRTINGDDGGVPPAELVPEPGTYTLVGLGLIGAACSRRKKQ